MMAGWFAFSGFAKGANAIESDQVSGLLNNAETQSFKLKEDADTLERYSRSESSWESHADAINRIREDTNKMGELLSSLEQNRVGAAGWQQVAIDRVLPVAKELAANTTAAINHLNQYPQRLKTPNYQEYLEAIADSAANLASTIRDFVDYGKTKQRLDRLGAKLELPAGR
jgi:signal transduction histidine kinase